MDIETFELERRQSVWENVVKWNLTESGIHPYTLNELLDKSQIEDLNNLRLGYGQTNGSIELRDTISRLYSGSDRDNFLVTNGSAEANFISAWSLLNPGDEITLMLPNYQQIWGLARSFGCKITPLYLKEELNWQPDVEDLKHLVNPNTKMIFVCNPNNPTGSVLTQDAIDEIIKVARENDTWIYSDEVYRGAEYDGNESATFWGSYDKVIIASGLSKAYALPGIRIGWLAGPKDFIENAWAYSDYTSITTGVLSNRIATIALQPEMRNTILTRNRDYLQENLEVMKMWVAKHSDIFSFVPPTAAGIVFLKYNREVLDLNSTELTQQLRDMKSVLIVAGDCFGMDNYLRIGIGSEREYLEAGLTLISEFLDEIL
ncbi:MAG: aminotransferase class I/II-fold pyridoxal phosphate-dependent enzyme [Candidatus Kariarchaeaceae archaeon]|jgi:aspartate/methionine/tyrosine aminotransferase